MRTHKRHTGFTLVELLAVVGIIAVLVAIAIPVFTASTEKAEEAVCLANKRSLKGLIITAYLSGENMNTAFNDNKASFKCPAGGTLSYTFDKAEGIVEVTCSVHDDTDIVFSSLFQAYTDLDIKIKAVNSSALADPKSRATALYNSLDPQQQALLSKYTWTITETTTKTTEDPRGLRVFFADKGKVEAGEYPIVYKMNPLTGKYQVTEKPTSANFKTENGVVQITGVANNWGSFVNGKFVKDGWMDALPSDLDNPKAG